MLKQVRVGVVALVCLLLLAGTVPMAQAGTLNSLSVTVNLAGETCDASRFIINVNWTGVDTDRTVTLVDYDMVAWVATDGNGQAYLADWGQQPVGATGTLQTVFGGGVGLPFAARPITIKVFDITGLTPVGADHSQQLYDDIVGRGAPLVGELVYDPAADVAVCDAVPLVLPPEPPAPPDDEDGDEETPPAAVPGADLVPIPPGAVGGVFVVTTPAYWAPRADAATSHMLEAGKTVWVYGVDETKAYYKVMLSGKLFWVPVNTLGPNPDGVWKNTPLPTQVVE